MRLQAALSLVFGLTTLVEALPVNVAPRGVAQVEIAPERGSGPVAAQSAPPTFQAANSPSSADAHTATVSRMSSASSIANAHTVTLSPMSSASSSRSRCRAASHATGSAESSASTSASASASDSASATSTTPEVASPSPTASSSASSSATPLAGPSSTPSPAAPSSSSPASPSPSAPAGSTRNVTVAGYFSGWTADQFPPEKIDFSKYDLIYYGP
jgi:hypothetical protein